MIYAIHEMHCTVCGRKYPWRTNYGFSKTRTCSVMCHREFDWRDVLSIMGKEYYPRTPDAEELKTDIEMGYRDQRGNYTSKGMGAK
jgi:hypothetical protein